MPTLPSNATRDAARAAQERKHAIFAEIDADACANVYGVSPCTAGRSNSGTAQAGGASSITLAIGASAVTDFYKNMTVRITGGTGVGQERKISAYNGSTKVATVSLAWTTAPGATSTYNVINRPGACYNTRATCQDKPNYVKTTKTYKFASRGAPIPAGETTRPYIVDAGGASTVIDPAKGLASRNTLTLKMADESDSDIEQDPYIADRLTAAAGSFWTRWIRRNQFYAGRFVRVRRGYVVSPWSWLTFLDELYIIDGINGPDRSGQVQVILKDPLKFADRNKIPAPTDGKLTKEFKAYAHTSNPQSATSTTIVLATDASTVDGFYVGMEVYIVVGAGFGERRTITAYVGATRTATVAAWVVPPNSASAYEVSPLKIELTAGKGAQYNDPAVTLKREFVRIGEEVIEYTSKSGDTLILSSSLLRGAFGTKRADHAVNDNIQQCKAYIDTPVTTLLESILNDSGLSDTYIDLTSLSTAEANYYGPRYNVTVCLSEPESPSVYLGEILPQINAVMWWSPQTQKAVLKPILPELASPPTWSDDATFIKDSVAVARDDDARITYAAIYYGIFSAVSNRTEPKSYAYGEIVIDAAAESAIEYGDRRATVAYSRWFGAVNDVAMRGFVARRVNTLRDAPVRIKGRIDPKDYTLPAGEQIDVLTYGLTDNAGAPLTTRMLLTRVEDQGDHIAIEAITTGFSGNYGFIAPNGTSDHPTDTKYAHISNNTPLMSNGANPYLII